MSFDGPTIVEKRIQIHVPKGNTSAGEISAKVVDRIAILDNMLAQLTLENVQDGSNRSRLCHGLVLSAEGLSRINT